MKKNVLIIVIVAVLIVGGVVAWYLLKGNGNSVVVPNPSPSGAVNTVPQMPAGAPSFKEAYQGITQAQRDCLLKALGQAKLDGFLNNDAAVMQTITGDEYQQILACPQ